MQHAGLDIISEAADDGVGGDPRVAAQFLNLVTDVAVSNATDS